MALADFKQGRAYAHKYLSVVNPNSALGGLIKDGVGTNC
jgi:hypothetical protein